jgi:hypothetical protein
MMPAPPPPSEDVLSEITTEDILPLPEIRLHIIINVVSCLNTAEEAKSLSVMELLLHEFLLDQILFLQKSLESWLVPCIVEELLGHVRVAAPPLGKDFPTPPVVGNKVPEMLSDVCPPLMEASMVVREPTEVDVFPSQSLESVTRSFSA